MTHDSHIKCFCKSQVFSTAKGRRWWKRKIEEKKGYFCIPMHKLCDQRKHFGIHMNPRNSDMRTVSQATEAAGRFMLYFHLIFDLKYLLYTGCYKNVFAIITNVLIG